MLEGVDISHHQGITYQLEENTDFCIMKVSEGRNVNDSCTSTFVKQCMQKGVLMGLYHYARPEYNAGDAGAIAEADAFVDKILIAENESGTQLIGNAILALDWEGVAWNSPIEWARKWLDRVYELTGVKAVLYCHYTRVNDADLIAQGGYGLWITYWSNNDGTYHDKGLDCGEFGLWALRQYTSNPLDRNKFNGDGKAWYKYASIEGLEIPEEVEEVEEDAGDAEEIKGKLDEMSTLLMQVALLINELSECLGK